LNQFSNKDRSVLSVAQKLSLPELLEIYVQSVQKKESNEEFFKQALKCSASLEKGNPEAVKVWENVRAKTIDHLTSFWNMFDIKYDVIQGESEFTVNSCQTEQAIKHLANLEVTEVGSDNRTYVLVPPDKKYGKLLKVPLVKSDGSSLYLLRDIACCLFRIEKLKYVHHSLKINTMNDNLIIMSVSQAY